MRDKQTGQTDNFDFIGPPVGLKSKKKEKQKFR